MKKRIGVILSGCGVYDGSEIQEAVLILLALDEAGAEAVCLAPDRQCHVVDHLSGEIQAGEMRNALRESARIARGKIQSIDQVDLSSLDAAIFPGGFGAAKNLSDFASKGAEATLDSEVEAFIAGMRQLDKPMGFACISPVLAALALGNQHPELTIGRDPETAKALVKLGARHSEHPATGIQSDSRLKIVSTPAYMCEASLSDIATGIRTMVRQVIELCS